MCEPATIATVAAVTAAVGAGAAAYGTYQQQKAAKQTATYNAAIARNNAIIAGRQANDRLTQGKEEESNFMKQLSKLKGKQRSIYAGSGIVADEGSPLETLQETAKLGAIDAFTIRRNAEREAYGIRNEGQNFTNQANLLQTTASNINPYFSGGTTLLTEGSRAGSMFATAGSMRGGGNV